MTISPFHIPKQCTLHTEIIEEGRVRLCVTYTHSHTHREREALT